MVTKKIGVIGCGNMGGAILYGALESGVLAKRMYTFTTLTLP
ncbi:MAG: NAD(P)-binding domain-containing protein [Lachnospiraceae bacterium]